MDQILFWGFENNTPETRSVGRGVMKTLRLMEEEQKQTSLLKSAVRQTRRLQPHPRPVPGVQDPHGPPTPPPPNHPLLAAVTQTGRLSTELQYVNNGGGAEREETQWALGFGASRSDSGFSYKAKHQSLSCVCVCVGLVADHHISIQNSIARWR